MVVWLPVDYSKDHSSIQNILGDPFRIALRAWSPFILKNKLSGMKSFSLEGESAFLLTWEVSKIW